MRVPLLYRLSRRAALAKVRGRYDVPVQLDAPRGVPYKINAARLILQNAFAAINPTPPKLTSPRQLWHDARARRQRRLAWERRRIALPRSYEFEEELYAREKGTIVVKALDLRRGEFVAVKIGIGADFKWEGKGSFEWEWAFAQRIGHHDNILAYHQYGKLDRTLVAGAPSIPFPYIAMELCDGCTLTNLNKYLAGGLGKHPDVQLLLLLDYLNGFQHIHRRDIVQRDVIPDNLGITAQGIGKLIDFGAAKQLRDEADREQVVRHDEDEIGDLFHLGITLFHSVSGKKPKRLGRFEREDIPADPATEGSLLLSDELDLFYPAVKPVMISLTQEDRSNRSTNYRNIREQIFEAWLAI